MALFLPFRQRWGDEERDGQGRGLLKEQEQGRRHSLISRGGDLRF
uniref:Uncharacterized protein n=1 Tax=Arundo donax TaxID=35708 RepID=A0A0A9HR16_ARUDO